MSDEENTKEMTEGARSDFERIMQRFDSIDARLTALEEKDERRAMDTKPIWERALAEIVETREEMRDLIAKLDRKIELEMRVVHKDEIRSKMEIEDLRDRLEHLEKRPS